MIEIHIRQDYLIYLCLLDVSRKKYQTNSDGLWAGEPSYYVTSRLGHLSLPSLWGR